MTEKKIKESLVIKVGDEIEIDSRWNAYNQKVYTVLDVVDNRITCRIDANNILGNKTCIYFKDELAKNMIEKYQWRTKL